MSEIDNELLRIERAADLSTMEEPVFCLATVWNAEPETQEGLRAKEWLLDQLAPETEYGGYACPVEGCTVQNYPKNPEHKSEEDTERHGTVYRPISNDNCALKDYCLENDWDLITQTSCVNVGKAIHRAIQKESKKITGNTFPGGQYCLRPGCCLSAGLSEDQVPGTSGNCQKKLSEESADAAPETGSPLD